MYVEKGERYRAEIVWYKVQAVQGLTSCVAGGKWRVSQLQFEIMMKFGPETLQKVKFILSAIIRPGFMKVVTKCEVKLVH